MCENIIADDSPDGDVDLVVKPAEPLDEPFIWELQAPSTPESEEANAPPAEALPAEGPSE